MALLSSRWLPAIAPLLVVACSGGGGGGSLAPNPGGPGTASGLGDLQDEVAYATSDGHGTVLVLDDPTIPDVGIASIDPATGQRVVRLNPIIMSQLPPSLQKFWRCHELGHHYMDHVSGTPSVEREHYADAYGIRTLWAAQGEGATSEVIRWFLGTGNQGDATHASHAVRAQYMMEVVDAVEVDSTVVPEPPTGGGGSGAPGLGTLVITNITTDPCYVFVNGANAGGLDPGVSGPIQLPEGTHLIQFVSAWTGRLLYQGGATVFAGQTTYFP